uniref:hypothetical protein n=1 Tax=Olsenella uli TaxID=133926 RepID=UPI0024A8E8C1
RCAWGWLLRVPPEPGAPGMSSPGYAHARPVPGQAGQGGAADSAGGKGADEEPVVPEPERVAPEGTRRVRLPGVLTGGSVASAQAYARDLLEGSPRVCEAAYANGDGTVDVWQTQAQSEEVSGRARNALESSRVHLVSVGISLEVSGDFRSVTLTVGEGANRQDLAYGISRAFPGAADLQVEATGGEGFSLSVDLVDGTTGEVMGHFDQDSFFSWRGDLSWVGEGEGS